MQIWATYQGSPSNIPHHRTYTIFSIYTKPQNITYHIFSYSNLGDTTDLLWTFHTTISTFSHSFSLKKVQSWREPTTVICKSLCNLYRVQCVYIFLWSHKALLFNCKDLFGSSGVWYVDKALGHRYWQKYMRVIPFWHIKSNRLAIIIFFTKKRSVQR